MLRKVEVVDAVCDVCGKRALMQAYCRFCRRHFCEQHQRSMLTEYQVGVHCYVSIAACADCGDVGRADEARALAKRATLIRAEQHSMQKRWEEEARVIVAEAARIAAATEVDWRREIAAYEKAE